MTSETLPPLCQCGLTASDQAAASCEAPGCTHKPSATEAAAKGYLWRDGAAAASREQLYGLRRVGSTVLIDIEEPAPAIERATEAVAVTKDGRRVATIICGGRVSGQQLAAMLMAQGAMATIVALDDDALSARGRDGIDVLIGGPPCSIEPMGAEQAAVDMLGERDDVVVLDMRDDHHAMRRDVMLGRPPGIGNALRNIAVLEHQARMATGLLACVTPIRKDGHGGPPKQHKADWRRSMKGGGKSRKL